jgi:predicted phage baseplate assembly protein
MEGGSMRRAQEDSMSLRTPNLDDRKFQDIVDELKSRIPLYCPEWTDHNVSDPGVTLIELFAYMAEQLLFRMNQVPYLHYMRFVQFLGIPIPTPQPARVAITFWLAKPLVGVGDDDSQTIPITKGTEVSTTQTETTPPLIFSIEAGARIRTPWIADVVKESRDGKPLRVAHELLFGDSGATAGALSSNPVEVFSTPPRANDAFSFYFGNDLSHHILQLRLDCEELKGINIQTSQPPLVWEAFGESGDWERIRPEDCEDDTKGLNAPGTVRLHLPRLARLRAGDGAGVRYAVRVRLEREEYVRSPKLRRILEIAVIGITLSASSQQQAEKESLGTSAGAPGERYRLRHGPIILDLQPGETLQVGGEAWRYVPNFAWPEQNGVAGGSAEKCFTVDVLTNEVCLPPAIAFPDGRVVLYGAVPERNAAISFTRYRYGGGVLDIERGAINMLKTSIPFVDRVENRAPAIGGQQDLASLDALQMTTQRFLRTGGQSRFRRAVTAEEYENLVLERFPEQIGKVQCCIEQLDNFADDEGPSTHLTVYVAAKVPIGHVLWGTRRPEVSANVIAEIDKELHKHRLLAMRVRASNPQFVPLHVEVQVLGPHDAGMEARIRLAVAAYLNPIYGGDNGHGWALEEEDGQAPGVLCTDGQLLQHLIRTFAAVPQMEFHGATVKVRDTRQVLTAKDPLRARCIESLDKGAVNEVVRDLFKSNSSPYYLSNDAEVRVRKKGEIWSIRDSERTYRLRDRNKELTLYDYSDGTPEARLYILSNFQLVYQ